MRVFKVIFLSFFIALSAFSALAQSREEAFNGDPGKAVQVFPNPAIDFVSVKFEAALAKTAKISLHDIIGNEIQVESEILDEHEVHLKIKDLPTGYYLITVKHEATNQRSILKFLKR
jgi:hypothetical protein